MKRWEYHLLKIPVHYSNGRGVTTIHGRMDDASIAKQMQMLGAQGWELVSSFDRSEHQGQSCEVIMIFKRELA